MTPEQLAQLREPFKPEQVGKLPRVTCKACSDRNMNCDRHQKAKCQVCDAYISTAHIHLDFVGHALVTDRLLQVDPEWTWEPFALDAQGLPAVRNGELWIRLTVAGVTRVGVGDGPDGKQLISDALRNAAMRFGVALDLWSKQDLASGDVGVESSAPAAARTAREPVPPIAGPDANTAASGPALSSGGSTQKMKDPYKAAELPSDRDTTTLANIESMSPVALAEALRRRKAPDNAFGTPQQMRQALKKMLEQEA